MQWAGCTQIRCRIDRTLRRPIDRPPVTGRCGLASLLNHRQPSRGRSARGADKHAVQWARPSPRGRSRASPYHRCLRQAARAPGMAPPAITARVPDDHRPKAHSRARTRPVAVPAELRVSLLHHQRLDEHTGGNCFLGEQPVQPRELDSPSSGPVYVLCVPRLII